MKTAAVEIAVVVVTITMVVVATEAGVSKNNWDITKKESISEKIK